MTIAIQLFFDFAFYLLFSAIPRGKNDMLDMFKTWAKYAKLDALALYTRNAKLQAAQADQGKFIDIEIR